jgi:hypothetical protein
MILTFGNVKITKRQWLCHYFISYKIRLGNCENFSTSFHPLSLISRLSNGSYHLLLPLSLIFFMHILDCLLPLSFISNADKSTPVTFVYNWRRCSLYTYADVTLCWVLKERYESRLSPSKKQILFIYSFFK